MSSGQYEEVKLGGVYYYVSYDDLIDPKAFREKCLKCKRKKSAFRIIVTIQEVLKGDERETIVLDEAFKKRIEGAVRRKMVKDGLMVTPTFGCSDCLGPPE